MKVCFWGNIAGALKGNTSGGAELQIAMLAKILSKCGHEVVIIDFVTNENFITNDGIKVLKIEGWNNGLRLLRTFTHRLPKLFFSLKAQEADIYYCRIRDFRHILAYWAARKVHAKFILSLASDLDAMNFMMRLKYLNLVSPKDLWSFSNNILIEIIYPWLLRKADAILVQHKGQQEILRRRLIKSIVLSNLFDTNNLPVVSSPNHNDFIYVGWLDRRKGFAKFFELIENSSSFTFRIIGPPRDKTGYSVCNKLKSFPNVSLMGELSHSDTLYQIANSRALVSTSPMEGFPNIFIEAWACGIPVLSLYVDPGNIIRNEELGQVANGNMDILLKAMNATMYTDEFSKKAKAYIYDKHSVNEKRIKEINDLFINICKNS